MLDYDDIITALEDGNLVVFAVGSRGECAWAAYTPDAEGKWWATNPKDRVRALHAICSVWALGRAARDAGFTPA